jgi:hypothetical protein
VSPLYSNQKSLGYCRFAEKEGRKLILMKTNIVLSIRLDDFFLGWAFHLVPEIALHRIFKNKLSI